jgi:hypothetical protein
LVLLLLFHVRPSARCVIAANLVCSDAGVFRKQTTPNQDISFMTASLKTQFSFLRRKSNNSSETCASSHVLSPYYINPLASTQLQYVFVHILRTGSTRYPETSFNPGKPTLHHNPEEARNLSHAGLILTLSAVTCPSESNVLFVFVICVCTLCCFC